MFASQTGGQAPPPPSQQEQPPPQQAPPAPVGMGPSSYRSPETSGAASQEAQTAQLAQAMAAQQVEQAKQQFMQATQVVVGLGDQFPDMKPSFDQLGAAIMQLASQAIATLQPQPMAPPLG